MSIKKQYIKASGTCKCTFRLPSEAAKNAGEVSLVGEFNDWKPDATPMKKLKSGEFKAEVTLDPGKEYEFRYCIDQSTWENDWEADDYIPRPEFFVENSVVRV